MSVTVENFICQFERAVAKTDQSSEILLEFLTFLKFINKVNIYPNNPVFELTSP